MENIFFIILIAITFLIMAFLSMYIFIALKRTDNNEISFTSTNKIGNSIYDKNWMAKIYELIKIINSLNIIEISKEAERYAREDKIFIVGFIKNYTSFVETKEIKYLILATEALRNSDDVSFLSIINIYNFYLDALSRKSKYDYYENVKFPDGLLRSDFEKLREALIHFKKLRTLTLNIKISDQEEYEFENFLEIKQEFQKVQNVLGPYKSNIPTEFYLLREAFDQYHFHGMISQYESKNKKKQEEFYLDIANKDIKVTSMAKAVKIIINDLRAEKTIVDEVMVHMSKTDGLRIMGKDKIMIDKFAEIKLELPTANEKEEYEAQITLSYWNKKSIVHRDFDIRVTIISDESQRPYQPFPLAKKLQSFFGREKILADLIKQVKNIEQSRLIAVYGHARMGKSSLLYELSNNKNLSPTIISCIFNLDEFNYEETDNQQSWVNTFVIKLYEKVIQTLDNHKIHTENIKIEIESKDRGNFFLLFGRFLSDLEVELKIKNRILILVLDEYQHIEAYTRLYKDPLGKRNLIQFIKNITVSHNRIGFIVSGYHAISRLGVEDPYWTEALGKGYYTHRLTFLSKEESIQLVTEPMQRYGVKYESNEIAEEIYRYTNGYPWYIQIICDKMYDLVEDNTRLITTEILNEVIEKFILERDYFTQFTVKDFIPEKTMLIACIIAKAKNENCKLINNKKFVTLEYIQNELAELEKKFDISTLYKTVDDLVEKDVLESKIVQDEHYYALSVPLVQEWFDKTQSLKMLVSKL